MSRYIGQGIEATGCCIFQMILTHNCLIPSELAPTPALKFGLPGALRALDSFEARLARVSSCLLRRNDRIECLIIACSVGTSWCEPRYSCNAYRSEKQSYKELNHHQRPRRTFIPFMPVMSLAATDRRVAKWGNQVHRSKFVLQSFEPCLSGWNCGSARH